MKTFFNASITASARWKFNWAPCNWVFASSNVVKIYLSISSLKNLWNDAKNPAASALHLTKSSFVSRSCSHSMREE
jgi:hypothetical protein